MQQQQQQNLRQRTTPEKAPVQKQRATTMELDGAYFYESTPYGRPIIAPGDGEDDDDDGVLQGECVPDTAQLLLTMPSVEAAGTALTTVPSTPTDKKQPLEKVGWRRL